MSSQGSMTPLLDMAVVECYTVSRKTARGGTGVGMEFGARELWR